MHVYVFCFIGRPKPVKIAPEMNRDTPLTIARCEGDFSSTTCGKLTEFDVGEADDACQTYVCACQPCVR